MVRKQVKVERIVDYKWNDPAAGERVKRATATEERVRDTTKLSDINQMRVAWKRNPAASSKNRPGTQSGSTILTGGLGAYGEAETKREKLG